MPLLIVFVLFIYLFIFNATALSSIIAENNQPDSEITTPPSSGRNWTTRKMQIVSQNPSVYNITDNNKFANTV